MTKPEILLFDCAGPCGQEGFTDEELNECSACLESYCDDCFDEVMDTCKGCAE